MKGGEDLVKSVPPIAPGSSERTNILESAGSAVSLRWSSYLIHYQSNE